MGVSKEAALPRHDFGIIREEHIAEMVAKTAGREFIAVAPGEQRALVPADRAPGEGHRSVLHRGAGADERAGGVWVRWRESLDFEVTADAAIGVDAAEVDATGRTRAAVRLTENGPDLFMLDDKGQARMELFLAGSGAGLNLYDSAGAVRARVHAPDLGPSVDLFDASAKPTWSSAK